MVVLRTQNRIISLCHADLADLRRFEHLKNRNNRKTFHTDASRRLLYSSYAEPVCGLRLCHADLADLRRIIFQIGVSIW